MYVTTKVGDRHNSGMNWTVTLFPCDAISVRLPSKRRDRCTQSVSINGGAAAREAED